MPLDFQRERERVLFVHMTEVEGSGIEAVLSPAEVDFDAYYKPVFDAGYAGDAALPIREGLETSQEMTEALREIGVADGIIAYAGKQWPSHHGGSAMQTEGVQLGIMRRRTELTDGAPLEYNNLIVWATDAQTSKRTSETFNFHNSDWLANIGGLPHGMIPSQDPPETKVAQGKLRSLVEKQPVYISRAPNAGKPRG